MKKHLAVVAFAGMFLAILLVAMFLIDAIQAPPFH
jgi:hypothetical protein